MNQPKVILALICVSALNTARLPAMDWPCWRGPNLDASTSEKLWPGPGSAIPEPAWKINVGESCSSVITAGAFVFATGWKGNRETLYCLNLADGRDLWDGDLFGPDGSCLITGDEYLIILGKSRLAVAESAERSPASYKELSSRGNISAKDSAWPHVVFSNGRIYCKDKHGNITCFEMNSH